MNILKKASLSVAAMAVLALTMTGCGGDSKPDAKSITTALDKGLDKTFESRNNGGNPFDITNLKIVSMEKGKQENRHIVVVDFTVKAIKTPGKFPMSMSYGKKVLSLVNLKEGKTFDMKNIQMTINSNDGRVEIIKTH